jgi:hypothetical protein
MCSQTLLLRSQLHVALDVWFARSWRRRTARRDLHRRWRCHEPRTRRSRRARGLEWRRWWRRVAKRTVHQPHVCRARGWHRWWRRARSDPRLSGCWRQLDSHRCLQAQLEWPISRSDAGLLSRADSRGRQVGIDRCRVELQNLLRRVVLHHTICRSDVLHGAWEVQLDCS